MFARRAGNEKLGVSDAVLYLNWTRKKVRAVSVREKKPESAGISMAAAILRKGRNAVESVLKQPLRLLHDSARNYRFSEIIANSRAMLDLFKEMDSAAVSLLIVLIEGETGAGKELVDSADQGRKEFEKGQARSGETHYGAGWRWIFNGAGQSAARQFRIGACTPQATATHMLPGYGERR
jgi:sigma-54 interacting transcriptional regulator